MWLPSWYGLTGFRPAVLWSARATIRCVATGVAIAVGLALIAGTAPLAMGRVSRLLGRATARTTLAFLGIRVRRRGPVPPRGAIIVANHITWIDAVAMLERTGGRFFAIDWTFDVPLLGRGLTAMGCIPVDHTGLRSLPGLVDAVAAVGPDDAPLVFFPEATTRRGDAVQPFRAALLEGAARRSRPVWWAVLNYTTPRSPQPAGLTVPWADWTPLVLNAWRMAHLPVVVATVGIGAAPVAGGDRRRLARSLHSRVTEAFIPLPQADQAVTARFSRSRPRRAGLNP